MSHNEITFFNARSSSFPTFRNLINSHPQENHKGLEFPTLCKLSISDEMTVAERRVVRDGRLYKGNVEKGEV